MAGFKRRYDDGAVPKPERFASGKKTTTDHRGNLTTFDAIVKQNNANKRTKTPKILKKDDDDDSKQKEIEKTRLETTKALMGGHVAQPNSSMSIIRYKHSGPGAVMQRMIRMVETPADPLEPPKFKHKRLPRGGCLPHVPVMHSPPRPLTVEEQNDWKVPPCISNWKNPKGYTIPLDKRRSAEDAGRELVQVSHKFAHLSESLYVAEQHARDATNMKSKVHKETMLKETEKKEQQLLAIAKKTLSERTTTGQRNNNNKHCDPREDQRIQRDKIPKERSKQRERERRLGKKPKLARDRDVSEKVALGMASLSAGGGQIIMYDQRLFNQEKGMDSGFGDDDQYSVYDKALFTAQPACLSTLYKDDDGIADQDKIRAAAAAGVEFEREDADPFGLDQFITQVKGKRNRP